MTEFVGEDVGTVVFGAKSLFFSPPRPARSRMASPNTLNGSNGPRAKGSTSCSRNAGSTAARMTSLARRLSRG